MAAHDKAGLVRALIAGIAANLALAITKYIAFFFTGSSAMLAEALHSTADCSNQGLLALGLKRAERPPTEEHPLGFGKERYFWAFIVAIMIFAMGSAFAIYEGVHKLIDPSPVRNPGWSYAALTIGLVVEGYALRIAWIEFKEWRKDNPGSILQGLAQTKDPTLPTVLLEDSAALIGLLVALIGVTLTVITGSPTFDAIASIVIGLVLLGVAWFLARESYSLLLGESASQNDRDQVREAVLSDPNVRGLNDLVALQRGPDDVLVLLSVEFVDELDTDELEATVARIEMSIRTRIHGAKRIFIEAGSLGSE
ncbi:MAG: cation transporter [Planctomycetes bacterium]|nr:cation transporter [Planctomycetota bacterium]